MKLFHPTKMKPREGVKIEILDTRGGGKSIEGRPINGAFLLPVIENERMPMCSAVNISVTKEKILVDMEMIIIMTGDDKPVPSQKWIDNSGCESSEIKIKANSFMVVKLTWKNPEITIKTKPPEEKGKGA